MGAFVFSPSVSWGRDLSLDVARSATVETADQNNETLKISPASYGITTDAISSDNGMYDRYLKGRLQIGTRSVYRVLTHADSGAMGGGQGSGTFLGSIYALDEEQNYLPIQPFLAYYFNDFIGLELAYDSFSAKTVAYSEGMVKTDGEIDLEGPTLTLLARYPNETPFTPYVGVGFGYYYASFSPDAAWALGYANPVEYKNLGSPNTLDDGYYRAMVPKNTVALQLTAGVSYQIYKHWSVDLSAEYIKADVDAVFKSYSYGESFINEPGTFPMSNVTFRFGIVYDF